MVADDDVAKNAQVDVLVVGAGPVGLTLACELRRRAVNVRIIDREDGLTPIEQSRALGIHARTLEALNGLRLSEELIQQGTCFQALNAWDAGQRFAEIALDYSGLATPYPFVLILPQGKTERGLLSSLARFATDVEWGSTLTGLTQDAAGVTAEIEIGAQKCTIRARYLVGCDGAHSAVRHALGLSFDGHPYPEQFLLADVELDWPLTADAGHLHLMTGSDPLVAIPLGHGTLWRLITRVREMADDSQDAVVEQFRGLLRDTRVDGVAIGECQWAAAFRVHRRTAGRFRADRCFVAGDAAHIFSPAGGQGMNLGIQDACNLAWKLALVLEEAAPDGLLDSYEAERLPVARNVIRGTHVTTRLVMMRSRLGRSIRNTMLKWFSRSARVRRALTRQVSELAIDYRHSPIVGSDSSRGWKGPRPGERMPDLPLSSGDSKEGRLFNLIDGMRHVLLVFSDATSSAARQRDATKFTESLVAIAAMVVGRWPGRVDVYAVIDTSDAPVEVANLRVIRASLAMRRSLDAELACAYLIRPDGYIAYRCRPIACDLLENYLQSHFCLDTSHDRLLIPKMREPR